jgi:hypothetical protein
VAHTSSAELPVMHGLRVKGMADAAAVAQRFALDRELVDELLLDYEAFGWITRVHFADVDGWSLTAPGVAERTTFGGRAGPDRRALKGRCRT